MKLRSNTHGCELITEKYLFIKYRRKIAKCKPALKMTSFVLNIGHLNSLADKIATKFTSKCSNELDTHKDMFCFDTIISTMSAWYEKTV